MSNKPEEIIEKEGEHTSKTTKHPDGRQDVVVSVGKTLNVKENTPEGKKAKEVIEKEVIPALANRVVIVTLINKKTGGFTSSKLKLPRVREWAEAMIKPTGEKVEDFFVVEHEGEDVRVTTLK